MTCADMASAERCAGAQRVAPEDWTHAMCRGVYGTPVMPRPYAALRCTRMRSHSACWAPWTQLGARNASGPSCAHSPRSMRRNSSRAWVARATRIRCYTPAGEPGFLSGKQLAMFCDDEYPQYAHCHAKWRVEYEYHRKLRVR